MIFVIGAVAITIAVCIVGIILSKKLNLQKFISIICLVMPILALAWGGHNIVDLSLDLKYNSFETYVGNYSHPARDTLIIEDGVKKLFAAASVPNGKGTGTVIYSKRSEMVVDFYPAEQ